MAAAEEKDYYLKLSAKDVLWYAKSFEMSPHEAMRDIYNVGSDMYFLNYLILMRKAGLRLHEHIRTYIEYYERNSITKDLSVGGIDYDKFVILHYFVDGKNRFTDNVDVEPHRGKVTTASDFKYFSIRRVVDDVYIHGKPLADKPLADKPLSGNDNKADTERGGAPSGDDTKVGFERGGAPLGDDTPMSEPKKNEDADVEVPPSAHEDADDIERMFLDGLNHLN